MDELAFAPGGKFFIFWKGTFVLLKKKEKKRDFYWFSRSYQGDTSTWVLNTLGERVLQLDNGMHVAAEISYGVQKNDVMHMWIF